ncbi:MAG: hypothetical protein SFX19_03775 [Alphaproteobacteria bacterium]|nr:hypothetical protein [Alphaproteobacteria bacterium]
MTTDNINEWVDKAKQSEADDSSASSSGGVRVVRNQPQHQSIGNMIMAVADKIRPHIAAMCDGVRNNEGMLIQPAHIRGIALEMAEGLVKDHQRNSKKSA